MTELAVFIINTSGRVEVTLGAHVVGTIEPWDGVQRQSSIGNIGAYYSTLFSGAQRFPASSPRAARRLILHRLAIWFETAGPLFSPIAETLAAQAELERETA